MTMSCVVAPIETRCVRFRGLTGAGSAEPTPNCRTTSTFAVHALSADAQLFHYEQSSLFPTLRQARLPREALDGHKEIHVRADLESIGVAICSIEVIAFLSALPT
jgi:hypothetical protein